MTQEEKLQMAEELLKEARSTLDDVHASETEIYDDITEFLYGEG